jgi:hypothetical protein
MLKIWYSLTAPSTAAIPRFCHALQLNMNQITGGSHAQGNRLLRFTE